MNRTPLTEDELGLLMAACEFRGGFRPKPEYMPACEQLQERGWIERDMRDGHAWYELTGHGEQALELNHLIAANVTAN